MTVAFGQGLDSMPESERHDIYLQPHDVVGIAAVEQLAKQLQ